MSVSAFEAIQTRLLLLCCGRPDWTQSAEGDPPLAADGVLEAELVAATLPRFDVIAASRQRASQDTAQALLAQRPVAVDLRDGLEEIRSAVGIGSAEAYAEWLDRLFTAPASSDGGESLTDGVDRLTAALRAIADRYHGRATLVISHPVILSAFRGWLLQTSVQREQVDALPPLAHAVLDYFEGRYYLVQDFPARLRM